MTMRSNGFSSTLSGIVLSFLDAERSETSLAKGGGACPAALIP
jgi:hypothetical protein